ncbi:MAG: hypothetical protein KAJ10_09765 [Thermodesulfovibrionia bacterium]|nr:hypothetical protein [Thermodesulfovibrionia bacterium]
MNFWQKVFNSKRFAAIQGQIKKNNNNEAVFDFLIGHGFSFAKARRTLMLFHELILEDLIGDEVTVVTASNTIAGKRRNRVIMKALSDRVGVRVERLFPKDETLTHKILNSPAGSSINNRSTSVM